MTNLVMGAITNYTFKDIAPWLNSLKSTGYYDTIALACFNISQETIRDIKAYDKDIVLIVNAVDLQGNAVYSQPNFNICVSRFAFYHRFLEANAGRFERVILTDVKDVIFQRNPFNKDWYSSAKIIASNEFITYENEDWGRDNYKQVFGEHQYKKVANTYIKNAGVIEGTVKAVAALSDMIHTICLPLPQHIPGGGGPDQAAYNYVSNLWPYDDHIEFAPNYWACQAGTQADPRKIDRFKPFLLNSNAYLENNTIMYDDNIPYYMVHQYDRVPEWKAMVERIYK